MRETSPEPLAEEAPAASPAADILVVDDEPAYRQLIRRTFEMAPPWRSGVSLRQAESVEEALHAVEAKQPDLLILDLGFPRGGQGPRRER